MTKSLILTLTVALTTGLAVAGAGPGGPPDDAGALVAKILLIRAETSPDDDVSGRVELLSVAMADRERFRVVVCQLAPEAVVTVLVRDATGAFVEVGDAVADDDGRAVLERDTGDGDELPAGATSLADLAGRDVNVVDADDALLLSNSVPSLEDSLDRPWQARVKIRTQDGEGPQVKLKLRLKSRQRERLELKVKRLEANQQFDLLIEDPDTGQMCVAMQLQAKSNGKLKLKLKAAGDQDLVPGVGGVSALAGLRFEIRTRSGQTIMSGQCPTP